MFLYVSVVRQVSIYMSCSLYEVSICLVRFDGFLYEWFVMTGLLVSCLTDLLHHLRFMIDFLCLQFIVTRDLFALHLIHWTCFLYFDLI